MPVVGATNSDYNPKSFWYYPWGKSGTHKGVDIFAQKGTDIKPATAGLVVYTGTISMGGNVIVVLGPKWRFHYYAHLNEVKTHRYAFVGHNDIIATVGNSGNAQGKAPHLHYAICTSIPYFWQIDNGPQGSRKMFYVNPVKYLGRL